MGKRNKRSDFTADEILSAYTRGGSYTAGASLLGVPRKTFTYWINQLEDEAIRELDLWGFARNLSEGTVFTTIDDSSSWNTGTLTLGMAGSQAVDNALGGFQDPDTGHWIDTGNALRDEYAKLYKGSCDHFSDAHTQRWPKDLYSKGNSDDIKYVFDSLRAYGNGGVFNLETGEWLPPQNYWEDKALEKQKECYDNYIKANELNSRILVISDLHVPYHHPDAIAFLRAIKHKYKPTRIISVGDEVDYHAISFHDSDPDLMSPGDELKKAQEVMHELYTLFPKMDIMHSNHGSLLYRRGKHHGIPRHMLKSYAAVLGIPEEGDETWTWKEDLTLLLPNGQHVYFHHGKGANALRVAQQLGMSYVAGHYHSQFNVQYYGNPLALHWAMQVGCLIDDHSMAFAYNRLQAQRPIIGTAMIIDGQPKLIPLVKLNDGRWDGNIS